MAHSFLQHTAAINTTQVKRPVWSKTTYRVRLPNDLDRKGLSQAIQALFSIKATEFIIHSLSLDVSEVAGLSRKVATISFRESPADLHDGQDWGFDLPTIDEDSFPARIYFDTHFKGFTPLTPAENDASCDINCIVLHGWGGHAIGSFTWPGTTYNWTRDDLCRRFQKMRVWTYGYGSRMNDINSVSSAYDLGKGLAIDLRDFRHNSADKQNPMIFIVHSLGGILFQEAVISMARSRPSSDDQLNLQLIRGAMFFGVPGQGMDVDALASMVEGLSNQYTSTMLDKNVGWRWRDNQEDAFSRIFPDSSLRLVQFYETRKTPVKTWDGKSWVETGKFSLLVEPSSATSRRKALDAEDDTIPLDKNHLDIVKFSENDVSDYRKVCSALGTLIVDAHASNRNQIRKRKRSEERVEAEEVAPEHKEYLRSLAYDEMFDRQHHISEAEVATCTWLPSHASYRKWLVDSCSILWIKGKPGAGKSTLLKYAYNVAREDVDDQVLIASFFFHGRGSDLQKSLSGFYRSLLHQIIERLPGIRKSLDRGSVPFNFNETQDHVAPDRQELELADVFEKCLLKAAVVRSLQIYIDALDECGVEAVSKLIEIFRRVLAKLKMKHGAIKVCFSCRHYPEIAINDGLDIVVEKENTDDIRRYIDTRLARLEGYTSTEKLLDQIVKKSKGVFQWTVFVVSQIISSSRFGFDAKIIGQKIDSLPSDLYKLYENVLTVEPSVDRQRLLLLFQWTVFAQQPLSVQNALPIIFNQEEYEPRFVDSIFIQDDMAYRKRIVHPKIVSQVRNVSKGLIEVIAGYATQTLQVIHHSVKDYLLDGGFSSLGAPLSTEGYSHFALSQSCLEYLNMQEIRNEILGEFPSDSVDLSNGTKASSSSKYTSYLDVVPYSLTDHIRRTYRSYTQANLHFKSKDHVLEKSRFFLKEEYNPTEPALIEWGENGQVTVPCVYAASSLIRSRTKKISGDVILMLKSWAFQRVAWRFPFFDLAVTQWSYHAKLAQASAHEDYDWKTFSAILDRAADILVHAFTLRNHFEGDRRLWMDPRLVQRAGLYVAAINGLHSSVFWFCGEQPQLDTKDLHGRTALHVALRGGFKEVADVLLNFGGIDIFTTDFIGDTLLHAAVTGGMVPMLSDLLAQGLQVDVRNKELMTPLHKAAYHNSLPSMIVLLDAGADISAEDCNSETPFDIVMSRQHWGEYIGDNKVAKYWKKEPHWKEDLQKWLKVFKARGVNTNRHSKSVYSLNESRPADSWLVVALRHLFFEIAKSLLDCGADIDEKDKHGATPLLQLLMSPRCLSLGSKNARARVLKFLLLHGANIHQTIPDGTGVLLLATSLEINQEFKDVMLLLLEHGANPCIRNRGGTSVIYASVCRIFSHYPWDKTQKFRWADRREMLASLIKNGADISIPDFRYPQSASKGYSYFMDWRPAKDDDQQDVFSLVVSYANEFLDDPMIMQWSTDNNRAAIMEDAYVAGIYLDIITLLLGAGAIIDPDKTKYTDLFSVARKYSRVDLVDRITQEIQIIRSKQGVMLEPATTSEKPPRTRASMQSEITSPSADDWEDDSSVD